MNDREIQENLLDYYIRTKVELAELPLLLCKEIINKKNVDLGMCWCASAVFKTDIYDRDWTKVNFLYPRTAHNKRELIGRLNIRIYYLKSLLK